MSIRHDELKIEIEEKLSEERFSVAYNKEM